MRIEAFIIAYNEKEIIGLTIKHYQKYCQRITIFDNYSTDETASIAASMGCVVKSFGTPGVLDDGSYLTIKNNCWKGSDCDFVIVCDCDEILYHPDFINQLEAHKTATIFNTQGWAVISRETPKDDLLEITDGYPDDNYSKHILFSPKLREIGYIYGCHRDKPSGMVVFGSFKPIVLHYRYIGGPERIIRIHNGYKAKKLAEVNKRWNLGHHYWDRSDEQKRIEWEADYLRRGPLSQAGIIS